MSHAIGLGKRVAVQPGGCSGLRYAMYLDDQVSEKDVTADQFGVVKRCPFACTI